MARMRKGSPEAKAWGRKMRAAQSSGKSVKSERPRGKLMTKKTFRKKTAKKRPVHLLTDGLAGTGAIMITEPVWQGLITGYKSGGLSGAVDQVESNLVYQGSITQSGPVKAGAILIVGAIGAKYLGKWLHLDRIGTKEVKLI